jgi:hypothetical protein
MKEFNFRDLNTWTTSEEELAADQAAYEAREAEIAAALAETQQQAAEGDLIAQMVLAAHQPKDN